MQATIRLTHMFTPAPPKQHQRMWSEVGAQTFATHRKDAVAVSIILHSVAGFRTHTTFSDLGHLRPPLAEAKRVAPPWATPS